MPGVSSNAMTWLHTDVDRLPRDADGELPSRKASTSLVSVQSVASAAPADSTTSPAAATVATSKSERVGSLKVLVDSETKHSDRCDASVAPAPGGDVRAAGGAQEEANSKAPHDRAGSSPACHNAMRPRSTAASSGSVASSQPQVSGMRLTSKLEEAAQAALHRILGVQFNKARPVWLRNAETNRCLELDLYAETSSFKCGVEIDETHHVIFPNNRHRTRAEFEMQRYRDRLKNVLCREHGCVLIRVPWTVARKDVEVFLRAELGLAGIVSPLSQSDGLRSTALSPP